MSVTNEPISDAEILRCVERDVHNAMRSWRARRAGALGHSPPQTFFILEANDDTDAIESANTTEPEDGLLQEGLEGSFHTPQPYVHGEQHRHTGAEAGHKMHATQNDCNPTNTSSHDNNDERMVERLIIGDNVLQLREGQTLQGWISERAMVAKTGGRVLGTVSSIARVEEWLETLD